MNIFEHKNIIQKELDRIGESAMSTPMFDNIEKPKHYNCGTIETIKYIEDVMGARDSLAYCQGNIIKYTGHRLWQKGDALENMRKAKKYAHMWIDIAQRNKQDLNLSYPRSETS